MKQQSPTRGDHVEDKMELVPHGCHPAFSLKIRSALDFSPWVVHVVAKALNIWLILHI